MKTELSACDERNTGDDDGSQHCCYPGCGLPANRDLDSVGVMSIAARRIRHVQSVVIRGMDVPTHTTDGNDAVENNPFAQSI